jgi:hypothetical protein
VSARPGEHLSFGRHPFLLCEAFGIASNDGGVARNCSWYCPWDWPKGLAKGLAKGLGVPTGKYSKSRPGLEAPRTPLQADAPIPATVPFVWRSAP